MITIAIALLMAATFTPITADHALATQAPQNETAENQITDDNRSFLAPFPDFDWRAGPSDPVRASHINDLQDASQHLLSRMLQGNTTPGACAYTIAIYALNLMEYVQDELPDRERDLTIWRDRIRREDRIHCDCGLYPPEHSICQPSNP